MDLNLKQILRLSFVGLIVVFSAACNQANNGVDDPSQILPNDLHTGVDTGNAFDLGLAQTAIVVDGEIIYGGGSVDVQPGFLSVSCFYELNEFTDDLRDEISIKTELLLHRKGRDRLIQIYELTNGFVEVDTPIKEAVLDPLPIYSYTCRHSILYEGNVSVFDSEPMTFNIYDFSQTENFNGDLDPEGNTSFHSRSSF